MRERTISASEEILRRAERRRSRQFWAGVAELTLQLAGFLATTLLMSWGLVALFFLAIGGGTTHGMVLQLHNFTVHYLAANAAGRATFNLWVIAIYLGLVMVLALLRRRHMFPAWPRSAHNG